MEHPRCCLALLVPCRETVPSERRTDVSCVTAEPRNITVSYQENIHHHNSILYIRYIESKPNCKQHQSNRIEKTDSTYPSSTTKYEY